jgi:hypothetical protein
MEFWCLSPLLVLLLRVFGCFGGDFIFLFLSFILVVCILNVLACSRYYVVGEAGCNWYHFNINIFPL